MVFCDFLNKRDMQCTYETNTETLFCYHCCSGKAVSIAYAECVSVVLGIQHAMRLRLIVISGLSGYTIFFPHYLINDKIFENLFLNVKCVFLYPLQLLSESFLIIRRTE
jgi:hypothetical protein